MAEADSYEERSKSFNWKIQYPLFFNDCNISSPSFSIDLCGYTRYYLDFVSKKISEDAHDVSLYLNRHEWHSELGDIVIDIQLNVIGDKINETRLLKDVKFFGREKIFEKNVSNNTSESIKEREIFFMNVAKDSTDPDIMVQLDILQHDVFEEIKDLWTCNLEDLESLSSDITGILHTKQFADITFKSSDDESIRLHRAILNSRYPTLAKFLNVLETQKEYNLEVDYHTITLLLRYLYSGKINVTDSIFGWYKLLKMAPLFHLQSTVYSEPDYIVVSTSVPIKHGYFTFRISNFNELQNNSDVVNYLSCDNSLLWTHLRILLYITENDDGERSVAFKIQRMEQDGKLLVLCNISIVQAISNQEAYTEFFQLNFDSEREKVIPSFIKISQIKERENSFLRNGALELGFDIVLSNLVETSENGTVEYLFPEIARPYKNLWALRKDIASHYMKPAFSDITIQHEDLNIRAHKFILCARSPVLSRLLENEKERKIIVFNGYERSTVLNLLVYMYGGTVYTDVKSYEWAFNLYKAANEYQVAQLKEKCIKFIGENVDRYNVSQVLQFAMEYDLASLEKIAKKFMRDLKALRMLEESNVPESSKSD